MAKCISKSICYNTTHPFINNFPLFLITLDGIRKSASTIDKSSDKEGLENRLHMNGPDGENGGTFENGNMGNDGVVKLEICSNIESGWSSGHCLCKKNICKTFVSKKIN